MHALNLEGARPSFVWDWNLLSILVVDATMRNGTRPTKLLAFRAQTWKPKRFFQLSMIT